MNNVFVAWVFEKMSLANDMARVYQKMLLVLPSDHSK